MYCVFFYFILIFKILYLREKRWNILKKVICVILICFDL